MSRLLGCKIVCKIYDICINISGFQGIYKRMFYFELCSLYACEKYLNFDLYYSNTQKYISMEILCR